MVSDLAVETEPGTTRTLTLRAPFPLAQAPVMGDDGDLVVFGIAGRETIDLIVSDIAPGPQLTFRLSGVAAAPEVHGSGAIPPFDPGATVPARPSPFPAMPVITGSRSDLHIAGGGYTLSLVLSVRAVMAAVPTSAFGARWRRSGGTSWTYTATFPAEGGAVTIPGVVDGQAYDVEVWAISANWYISDSASISACQAVIPQPAAPSSVLPSSANGVMTVLVGGDDTDMAWELTIQAPTAAVPAMGGQIAPTQVVRFTGSAYSMAVPLKGTYQFSLRGVGWQGALSSPVLFSLTNAQA